MNYLIDLYEDIFNIDPYERLVTKILIKEAAERKRRKIGIGSAILRGLTSPALYGSLGILQGMLMNHNLPSRIFEGLGLGALYFLPSVLYSRILPQVAMEHALQKPIQPPLSYYFL